MICALKLVKSWCETKGLKVNPLKSNVIIFTRKCKPEPVQPLKIGRREIAFTNSVKYLGIFLDPNLNWKQHLTERMKKNTLYVGV